jgi:hypothetical protein
MSLWDWAGVLVAVFLVGGSIAFGLGLYAARDGGLAVRTATEQLLRDVAARLHGEYQLAGQLWSLHRSIRVFGAAVGCRAGLDYELSRYPFNVDDDAGRAYLALRSRSGRAVFAEAALPGPGAEPELTRALGRQLAHRLRPEAVAPMLDLVRASGHVYGHSSTLVVIAPTALWTQRTPPTPAALADWVERVLEIASRIYPDTDH